jgi:voltage-gated sodium channel
MFAARVAVSHGATIAPTEAAEAIKTDEPSSVATPSKIRKPTSGIVTLSLFEKARYHTRLTLATRWFQLLILFCIFTTSILAGIETYGSKDGLILALDVVVLAIFAIEVALRILVEFPTPWQFFIGQHWISNWFDFIVVVLGVFAADSENAASSFSLLPLLRLLRLSKLVSKVPAMKQILSGLAGGIKSAVYIIALIVLVLYIYAIVAIHVFKENNPFHYHSLPISLLSLFRAATLVDWTKIAYIDILGCDSDDFVYKSKEVEGLEKFWYCLSPESSYFLAPLFWSSFIVISSLVMLSLFVGSITIAMSESMERLKHEEVEHNRHNRLTEQLYSRLVETSGIERLSSVDISSSRRR